MDGAGKLRFKGTFTTWCENFSGKAARRSGSCRAAPAMRPPHTAQLTGQKHPAPWSLHSTGPNSEILSARFLKGIFKQPPRNTWERGERGRNTALASSATNLRARSGRIPAAPPAPSPQHLDHHQQDQDHQDHHHHQDHHQQDQQGGTTTTTALLHPRLLRGSQRPAAPSRYLSSETLMTPSSLGTIAAMFTTSCEPSTLLSRRGLRVSALGCGSAAMGTAAAARGGCGEGRRPHRGGGGEGGTRCTVPGSVAHPPGSPGSRNRGGGGTAPEPSRAAPLGRAGRCGGLRGEMAAGGVAISQRPQGCPGGRAARALRGGLTCSEEPGC